jgi:hypothetical protein
MTRKATLIVVLSMVFLSVLYIPVIGEGTGYAASPVVNIKAQSANETEPQPVNMYLYGETDGGELKTNPPQNNTANSAPPANYGGGGLPFGIAWRVGNWTTSHLMAPMTVETRIEGSLWATGSGDNVYFQVEVYHNGDEIGQITTETTSFSQDREFTFSGTISGAQMSPGDRLSIQIYAGSRVGSDFRLSWGSPQYDSHVIVACNPISVSLNPPMITEDNVIFSARILDAYGTTEFIAKIQVTNSVDVVSLSDPEFFNEDNGTLVIWIWDHKTDNGKDGDYRISVSVYYSEENEFYTVSSYKLTFPKPDEDVGLFGDLGWLFYIGITMVVISIILVVKKRRESKTLS